MSILPQLAFVLILGVAGFILGKRIQFLRRNILLGKAETRNDQPENRWKAMFFFMSSKNIIVPMRLTE